MVFERAVPPGPAGPPEEFYTGLALGDLAPPDRPYVVCNFVSSADGRATAQGRTALLGGEGDRAAFHLLRTQADAVLAGTGTLRVERYGVLTKNDAYAAIRVREGRDPQPLGIVISRSGQIPFDIPLFDTAEARVAVFAPGALELPATAATIIRHPIQSGPGALAQILRSLRAEHEVRALLLEGGPALLGAMLAEDLIDELFLTLAPALVGGAELGITTGVPLPALLPLALVRALHHDGNLFLRYLRVRPDG